MEFRREGADGRLTAPGGRGPGRSRAGRRRSSRRSRPGSGLRPRWPPRVGDDAIGHALIERWAATACAATRSRSWPGAGDPGRVRGVPRTTGRRDFWFSVHDSAAMELAPAAAERMAEARRLAPCLGLDARLRRPARRGCRGGGRARARARGQAVAGPERAGRRRRGTPRAHGAPRSCGPCAVPVGGRAGRARSGRRRARRPTAP